MSKGSDFIENVSVLNLKASKGHTPFVKQGITLLK